MFLPLSTELAPERLPIGTLTLMLLNLLAAPLIDTHLAQDLVLVYGEIAPWQWITSAFLHEGPAHLGVNLLFLWPFGLIVESFLGCKRFLATYLAIAVSQSAFEQILALLLDERGGSLGASSAIYGLMTMALIWAPHSEIRTLFVIWLWLRIYEIRVLWFGIAYIGWDLVLVVVGGFDNGTPLLHVQGALFGGLAAWVCMRANLVDTGGHDLLALAMHGRTPAPKYGRLKLARKQVVAPTTSHSGGRPSGFPAALWLQSRAQEVLEQAYFGGAVSAAARCAAIVRESPHELRGLREAVLKKLAVDPAMRRAFEEALDARQRMSEV